ncbi:hypothetical protein [Amycolatopsis sp. NPDC003861]
MTEEHPRQVLAARLERLLAASDLTQKQAAQRVMQRRGTGDSWNVTQQRITDWISGRSVPHRPQPLIVLVRLLQERISALRARTRADGVALDGIEPELLEDAPAWLRLWEAARAAPPLGPDRQHPDRAEPARASPGNRSAESGYLDRVREIAPQPLRGREDVLDELTEFCTGDAESHPYLWLQAPKWAGKTALMSWFVLHPPPGVRIICFFITARLPGQDHRGAFVDVVIDQLCDLLELPRPPYATESTREIGLAAMIRQAAERCEAAGERLLLVVDGLDEDRGFRVGSRAHSIAALLPARLTQTMRVIVAGRPNPPLPSDVASTHPLRDPLYVRELAPSEHAHVIRDDMLHELHELLHGDSFGRDMLGLITVAGGLEADDIAELTAQPLVDVRRRLRTVVGRTFDIRRSSWQPEDGPRAYLLGHEDLRETACEEFGQAGLAVYRKRISVWADGYRRNGWPEDTPEYLLIGYHRLLLAEVDVPLLVEYVTDAARTDRMFARSHGDATALAQLRATKQVLLDAAEADVGGLLRISLHMQRLAGRSGSIPARLPAVWALLGDYSRAEALVGAVGHSEWSRREAIGTVALAEAQRGAVDRALDLCRSVAVGEVSWEQVRKLFNGCIAAGRLDAAEEIFVRFRDQLYGKYLPDLVRAHIELGCSGEVPRLLSMSKDFYERSLTAEAYHRAVAAERASMGIARALDGVRSLDDPELHAPVAAHVALRMAMAGDGKGYRAAREFVEQTIDALGPGYYRVPLWVELLHACVYAGDIEYAKRLMHKIHSGRSRFLSGDLIHFLAVVAVVTPGDLHTAAEEWVPENRLSDHLLADVAKFLIAAGRRAAVKAVAELVESEFYRLEIAEAVAAAAVADDPAAADELVASQAGHQSYRSERLIAKIAATVAEAGEFDRALGLADGLSSTDHTAVLVETAAVMADVDPVRARALLEQAESLARAAAAPMPYTRAQLVIETVSALASRGAEEAARSLAETIDNAYLKNEALRRLAVGLAEWGMLDAAEAAARETVNPYHRAVAFAEIAEITAVAGSADRARELADSIPDAYQRVRALARLAEVAAGEPERFDDLVGAALVLAQTVPSVVAKEQLLALLTGALARACRGAEATELARSITNADLRGEADRRTVQGGARPRRRPKTLVPLAELVGDSVVDAFPEPDAVAAALERVGRLEPGLARDRALSVIAEHADLETAKSLAREALAEESIWIPPHVLRPVARICPADLEDAVREIVALDGPLESIV